MKKRARLLLLAGCLFTALAVAQNYRIDWYSIDQPDAGTLAGGNYTLTGGFMSVVTAIQTPGGPQLRVTRSGGNVIISWPDPSTDFVLQEAGALANPSTSTLWNNYSGSVTTSGGEKRVTLPAPAGNKYFRLRKPNP
jgi:hypothetical protein